MSNRELIVVALGGNAIQEPDGEDSVKADFARTAETADRLARLAAAGWRLVVTHGNGPQVGNHLLRSELAHVHGDLPLLPLDVCVADTQGGMGYMLQQCLSNALHHLDVPAVVATIVTQILVDESDRGFAAPSKPVGEVIPPDRAEALSEQGWTLAEDKHRHGFRRVVASPHPLEIVEAAAIKTMVEDGMLVIAAGGGGIPVVAADNGDLQGVAAVVDKDLASALLAVDLQADALLVLTTVEAVALDYDTPQERPVRSMTVAEAYSHLADGQFAPGSMGPKVEAVARFVEVTGRPGIITSLEGAEGALLGRVGTRITP